MPAIPIHNRIIVIPDQAPEKIGNYEVAQTAQKKPKRGKVISVGPGLYAEDTGVLIPMQCKEGDTVLYSNHGGTEVELESGTVVVLKEDECLMIL